MADQKQKPSGQAAAIAARGFGPGEMTVHLPPAVPVDELIARFQLETERAVERVRSDLTRLVQELASKVAKLEDECIQMREASNRQATALESGLHHTRKAVDEVNEAMKVAAKAANEARDSALVYEKLKESQPDFAAQVRALEERIAKVVDSNTHLTERVNGLVRQIEDFEVVADSFEETQGEVRGLDLSIKKLDMAVRTRPT